MRLYEVSQNFPDEEKYGLTSQLRRSSVSIPSNIAEGCGKSTDADFRSYLDNAMGSASEVEYQLLLAHDLAIFNDKEYNELATKIQEIKRMLAAFIKRLRSS